MFGSRRVRHIHMDRVSLISVLSLAGAIQGVLLIVALRRIALRNRLANRVLSIFVALLTLALLVRFARHASPELIWAYPHTMLLLDGPVFTYGPLLYLYLYSLAHPAARLHRWWWVHFVPAALHMARQLEYWLEPAAVFAERFETGHFPFASFIMSAAVAQMGLYIVASAHLVYGRMPDGAAGRRPLGSYVKMILLFVVLGWAAWAYCAIATVTTIVPDYRAILVDAAWVTMSLLPMALAYFAIGRQEVFKLLPTSKKYGGSLLSTPDLAELEHRLTRVMETSAPYLQPGLTLAELADLIGCSTKDLSRVINERFDRNFFDFVNGYRVAEFKRLIRDDRYRNHTLLAVAYDAGFNSKTTFYAAFKKLTGTVPSDYLKSVESGSAIPEPRSAAT